MNYKLTADEIESVENAFMVSSSKIDRHSLLNRIIADKVANVVADLARKLNLEIIEPEIALSSLMLTTKFYRDEASISFTGLAESGYRTLPTADSSDRP